MKTQAATHLIHRCARRAEPDFEPHAQAGAWDRFVDLYGPAIAAGVRRALHRSAGARRRGRLGSGGFGGRMALAEMQEDLVQECYCRLLEADGRRLTGFRGTSEAEARAWLARVAERVTRDYLRIALAVKRGGRRPPSRLHEAALAPELLSDPRDAPDSPERRVIGRQELRRFARRCRRHSESGRDARVLQLVFLAGYTSREASRATRGALGPSGVDTVVHRFRRRLADDGLPLPHR